MTPPTTQKVFCKFIGLANYYCNMWDRISHTFDTLTKVTYIKIRFKCNEVEQKSFK